MGGDLVGDWGMVPKKEFEVGMANASVPPILGEVVLSDEWQSTKVTKIGVTEAFCVKLEVIREGKFHIGYIHVHVCYILDLRQ